VCMFIRISSVIVIQAGARCQFLVLLISHSPKAIMRSRFVCIAISGHKETIKDFMEKMESLLHSKKFDDLGLELT